MPNLNKITIIGHCGDEPEMRFTPSGVPVTNVNVAVNSFYSTNKGEKKENTEWFKVVGYKALAERMNKQINKGSLVFVEGKISLDKWTGKEDGKEYSRMTINAFSLMVLDKTNQSKNTEEDNQELPF